MIINDRSSDFHVLRDKGSKTVTNIVVGKHFHLASIEGLDIYRVFQINIPENLKVKFCRPKKLHTNIVWLSFSDV